MKKLAARPAYVWLLLGFGEKEPGKFISDFLYNRGASPRREGNNILVRLKTRSLGFFLPVICEHCETVCIGNLYAEIFKEHAKDL